MKSSYLSDSSMTISNKLPGIGTTILTVMSQIAEDYDFINLSQGGRGFSEPADLVERLNYYAASGFNQYPPMHGIPYLRQQIKKKVSNCYNSHYNEENEITVVSEATKGLLVAIQTVVRAGDVVIVFDPVYDAYDPAVRLAGGKALHIPLIAPEFIIDFQRLKDTISDRTRAIVINSPHNPSGAVLSPHHIQQLAELVESRDIYLIADEVYEHMTYDGVRHESLSRNETLKQRIFVVSSFGND